MTIKAIVETTDGMDETLAQLYEPMDDGGFRLAVEPAGGYELQDISGLKSALEKERGRASKLERDIKKFADIDPEKAREALAKWEELADLDPAKEADRMAQEKVEAIRRQLQEKSSAEIKTREDRIGQLTSVLQETLIDREATGALAEAKGSVDLLLPHVQRYTRVKETDNGRFAVEIVDGEGNARIKDSSGAPMTIKDLVAEMRASEKFGRAFEASGQSGAGRAAPNGAAGGAGIKRGNWAGDKKDRQAAIASKFPDLPAR